jgi:hypothetical protein
VTQFAVDQDLHSRNWHGKVREAQMLMDDLKNKALRPIARLARTLLPEDPNLADRAKDAKLNSSRGVIMFARNLLERAEPNKAKFGTGPGSG